ncbi:unnamed protein product [Ranitomeya imitator]|uniref:Prostaglandin-endoperoxide synthase n=1 Tax=Ranitomeya imitator TaxID=111125 RepID=A0ABN9LFG0_9NEOB|nr:unnamed protein product [Ranitomeya imitator]
MREDTTRQDPEKTEEERCRVLFEAQSIMKTKEHNRQVRDTVVKRQSVRPIELQHRGVCVTYALDQYECDCTRTGYYGRNCTIPELLTRIRDIVRPSPSFYHYILTRYKWFWNIINNTFIRDTIVRLVLTVRSNLIPSPPTYNSAYGYISWEAYANVSYFTRVLPPVPDGCPTPMGTKGKLELPNPTLLVETFLKRQKFIPDPQNTNLMFAFFAQHFTHQFFKTFGRMGRGFIKGFGHGVSDDSL